MKERGARSEERGRAFGSQGPRGLVEEVERYGVPARYARRIVGYLGRGVEGAAYDIGEDKVLKVNVTSRGQHIFHLQKRVKGHRWANPIRACGRLHPNGPDKPPSPIGFWYVSDRLYPLSSAEKRHVFTIGYAIRDYAKGSITKAECERVWQTTLPYLPPPLRDTLTRARRAGYHDLHGGNVMKTARGDVYRVIDTESLRPFPLASKGREP